MRANGYTLLEMTISLALLSVVSLMGFVIVNTSAKAMNLATTQEVLDANLRDALNAMRNELQLASKTANSALAPPLNAVAITANPVAGSPIEIAFQKPLDGTGKNWSSVIRYRFINEDTNGNAILNAGEDTDANRVLTRRIVRLQDRNGNGNTTDPGESMPIGGANDLSNVVFALDASKSVVTITLTASRRVRNDPKHPPLVATASTNVYLNN